MFYRLASGIVFSAALFAQTLQPPSALTVVTATNKQVQLRWTAGDTAAAGYAIERKVLGGDYATALSVTTTAATDSNFDPYTTYVYRVRGTLQANQSAASNEVTVGPPPYGYNTASLLPANIDPYFGSQFGKVVRMILDTSGDPALAYTWSNPNNDDDFSDSALYFVRWDRAHYQWTKPVQVHLVGDVSGSTVTPIGLAQDAGNGAFGIAFEDETTPEVSRISLALSADGGQTWKSVKVTADDGTSSYQRPSLALAAGNVYLSLYHSFDGIRYVTGKQSDDPAKWTSTLVPLPGGYDSYTLYASLALDSGGNPAMALLVANSDGLAEAFWRPGGASILVLDNGGQFTDGPDIQLTFSGTQPRIAVYGELDGNFFADDDHSIWIINSPDNGTTWSRPVNIPSDLGAGINGPLTVAAGPQGQGAIATENNSGDGTANCTQPKLAMSRDTVNWTTCGTDTAGTRGITALSPQVIFSGNGTLYLGFQQTNYGDDKSLPLGITVWRQPVSWAFPPPPPQPE